MVATDLREDALIWPFLSQSRIIPRMTVYSGLVGNVDIPTVTLENPVPAAVAEGASLADAAAATFGKVTLSPNTVGGRAEITRRLMTQTDSLINTIVRTMFDRQFSKKIEDLALAAILAYANLPAIETTTDDQMTYVEALTARKKLQDADVPGERTFLMNPTLELDGLTRLKAAGYQEFVIHNNMIHDMPVEISTRFAGDNLGLLAVLSEGIIGLWEGIDFVVNRSEDNGNFRISAWMDYDFDIKHTSGFVRIHNS